MFTSTLHYFLTISGVYYWSVIHQKVKNGDNMAQGSVWGKVTAPTLWMKCKDFLLITDFY